VLILCAPVRLEVVDPIGQGVPTPLRVQSGQKLLLRKEAVFSSLVIWLPGGGQYESSLGSFSLSASGKVAAAPPLPGVKVSDSGFKKIVDAAGLAPAVKASKTYRVTVSDGTGRYFDVFVPPLIAYGKSAWLAIGKSRYEQATERTFAIDQFKMFWHIGGSTLDGKAAPEIGTNPEESSANAASGELHVKPEDLVWIKLPVPSGCYGPLSFSVQTKDAGDVQPTVVIAELGGKLQLVPHRWRTAYADTETAIYNLLISGECKAGKGRILIQSDAADSAPKTIGSVDLPSVAEGLVDSRLLRLSMGDLPAGKFRLWVECGGEHSGRVPLDVIAWYRKSPFLVHSMSCCVECWPTGDQGLETLRAAGMEMGAATGHNSLLNTQMPRLNAALAAQLEEAHLPIDLAAQPTANDRLLERLLRHQMRLIDLTVARGGHFYNEGLSYHHSYRPSVDRMVRRMQLFTQQTADYPSFWGVNYNWFPALGGYVEGGVPTDAHTADRTQALEEDVLAAGFKPLSAEESQWLADHKTSKDSAESRRVAALGRQAVDYWRATQDFGFGKHNQLYNAAVHQVRPQTVCTLFENAGHDAGKRTRALFNDMAASCYEDYTDSGDWPMSCAFTTDWARGNQPRNPVWLTTNWGTTSEGNAKGLLHAFARGLGGGGLPVPAGLDPLEISRRAAAMSLLSQYGSLARDAQPDGRVSLLSRTAKQALAGNSLWQLHALYYHLTRLGYPPAILADEELIASGVPQSVQALVLVSEEYPLEAEAVVALKAFTDRGGKILLAGGSATRPFGSTLIDVPVKQLWDLKGFEPAAHAELWREFDEHWRAPLATAMQTAGVEPAAATDVDQALALSMEAGPVRYVAVLADAKGTHSGDFLRPAALPVSIEGRLPVVRDLVKQQTLPTTIKNGRTEVLVDLTTEPGTVLACFETAPSGIAVQISASPQLGSMLAFNTTVTGTDRGEKLNLGRAPLTLALVGPDGAERRRWHEAAGTIQRASLPACDAPGQWRLIIKELLTGLTATADFVVAPAETNGEGPLPDVHLVDADHITQFARRVGEKLIIVEPGQIQAMPVAQELAASLKSAGIEVRIWEVRPEEFDTVPLRWYPLEEDELRLKEIRQGRLIGYRGNMSPHIDKIRRNHVPELGGYGEIDPPYMVGQDCIVFSGGRLAESLRAVSPWMNTPHAPGVGQGRLLVCFSPFMADRQAAAVISNDAQGLAKAARRLAELLVSKPAEERPKTAIEPKLSAATVKLAAGQVERPLRNFSPRQRVKKLLASRSGKSAVLLDGNRDDLALVDERGTLAATLKLDDVLQSHLQLSATGKLLTLRQAVLARDPSWHFPTEAELYLQTVGRDGKLLSETKVFHGDVSLLPPDFEGGFRVSPIGASQIRSRSSGLLIGNPSDNGWLRYDDLPHARRRFEILYPRVPVGGVYSPDGRYVLVTLESRPPFGPLGSAAWQPISAETILLDVETGKPLWSLHDPVHSKATYAANSGFAAVSAGGKLTAIAGYDGSVFLVDKAGKLLLERQVSSGPAKFGRLGPPDGIGVWMSDDGELAAFGFKSEILLASGGQVEKRPVVGLTSACVASDGSLLVYALRDGSVHAVNAKGETLWSRQFESGGCQLAATGANRTLLGTSAGELLLIDANGKPQWRTQVAAAADKQVHRLERAPEFSQSPGPLAYREPGTLEVAKERLAAKQVAAWVPAGRARSAWGRKFHTTDEPVELAPREGVGDLLVHLVYRRPAENKSLQLTTFEAGVATTFELDLPTPEYRVVDLPLRGSGAKVTLKTSGPVEIAECSLWAFQWPGGNLAYVRPAGADGEAAEKPKQPALLDDIADELAGGQPPTGEFKDCKIYFPNPDVDQVAGPYLRPPLDPTQMVDGRRFEQGKLAAWAGQNAGQAPTRGGFLTIDFSRTPALRLVATYDRSIRQSQVCSALAIFTTESLNPITSGSVLAGANENDQFWRLFPLEKLPPQPLGIHVYSGASKPVGLSEVEAY